MNMVKELNIVVEEEECEYSEAVSPNGQYLNSSVLSIYILAVLDFENPIRDFPTLALLKDVFLPISPRFSSIMVKDENGEKQWKKVEVEPKHHINIPIFPSESSPESHDNHLSDYLSKIAMEQLPQNRPLWDIHIIKYPTSNAAGNIIFKLHHALGDGYSLMGALLSSLQRAENPSVPLTFPSRSSAAPNLDVSVEIRSSIFKNISDVVSSAFNTISDFGWSLLKSQDDKSLIRSGVPGVEFKPIVYSSMMFSLGHIKEIKTKLGATVNDVITGIIFLGARLYMQEETNVGGSSSIKLNNERSTALVVMNTRDTREYKSMEDMLKPAGAKKAWGNRFAFLRIPLPELTSHESCNPLDFVRKTHQIIQRKRNSGAVFLRGQLLEFSRKYRGPEVKDENGEKQWKKVEVKLKDHINIPIFPSELSPESYDNHLSEYLSKIAMEQLPQNRPLWDIHLIKYPTTSAAGNMILKLHHALGDGYSLMGAVLSSLQRADNPSVPLTFPSRSSSNSAPNPNVSVSIFKNVSKVVSSAFNTISDFGWSLLRSSFIEDDKSLIRSGDPGVEFKPIVFSSMVFSLDHIKQIKTKLGATINDVITGIIFLGARLCMQEETNVGGSSSSKLNNERSTALVVLNTRNIREYKSVEDMLKPDGDKKAWGNQLTCLHIPLPELTNRESCNPLDFVRKTRQVIQRKRNSGVVFLTGQLIESFRKYRGPEATSKYIYGALKNSSMTMSNMIGPVERVALADHPVKSLHFLVSGFPQSLVITMLSYMGKLRVGVGAEKDYIDPEKFKSSIEYAFEITLNAAQEIS